MKVKSIESDPLMDESDEGGCSHAVVNNTVYDVVIVGAGVVGSALALQLFQQGKRVALLDLHPASYAATNPERVIAVSQGSAHYLQSLGVWDEAMAQGVGNIKHIHVCEPQSGLQSKLKSKGTVDMHHTEVSADALGYVVEIRDVLQALHHALADKVAMICPAACMGLQRTAEGVDIAIQKDGKRMHIHAHLLVGADGTNSQVRQLAGIHTSGWDHNRMGIVASVRAEQAHGGVAYECFREEGPLALLPLADGRFSLVWSVAPQRAVQLMKLDEADFIAALQDDMGEDVVQQTGALLDVGKRASFPLELRIANTFAQAGIALIGNAAHTIHPVAGQGMNLGLRDAAVLAAVLKQSWATGALYRRLVAETYAEQRRLDTLAVVGFTEGLLESFSSQLLPARWLRGQALKGLQAMPSLKQVLLQQAAGLGQLKGFNN